MTPLLLIQDLEFSYDKTPVLQGVNLLIQEKEFIGIFGPNGGGKTTLLQLILGFLRPQKGKISLLGKDPQETRQRVGYVPQSLRFDQEFPLTVLDLVLMGALNQLNWLGRYPSEVQDKAATLLARVGLKGKEKTPFGALSGGQAQKALIARSLLSEPLLLILDEPTAHVDPEGERSIHELLMELKTQMAILMVTHDLQTILDKVGRLLCVQNRVLSLKTSEVCEHFALGLYHTPLATPHSKIKGPFSC
jgi:zinc transport system ATP-binding protein